MSQLELNKIHCGDALEVLKTFPGESVDCVITSPPYWNMRDYGVEGQLGLEPTFQEYIRKLVEIFNEVYRVLKLTGIVFVNLGDTYGTESGKDENRVHAKQGSLKGWIDGRDGVRGYEKCLLMIPERFAVMMCDGGWILRNKIIWHKKNAMPSSVLDRLSNKYELIYFFTKSKKYYFDIDSIRIPYETMENRLQGMVKAGEIRFSSLAQNGYNSKFGTKGRDMENDSRKFGKRRPPSERNEYTRNAKGKNPGDVWTLTLQPHAERHIAMFPEKLIAPMIKAGCPTAGTVLDPFIGSGTTALVAKKFGRNYVGIDLNSEYCKMAKERIKSITLPML